MQTFDINYCSAEKFFQDYLQLKSGKLFVQAEEPFSPKTHLALNITVPRIDYAFQLNGVRDSPDPVPVAVAVSFSASFKQCAGVGTAPRGRGSWRRTIGSGRYLTFPGDRMPFPRTGGI